MYTAFGSSFTYFCISYQQAYNLRTTTESLKPCVFSYLFCIIYSEIFRVYSFSEQAAAKESSLEATW